MTTPGTVPADPDAEARVYDWDAADTRFPPGWHARGDVEGWFPVNLRTRNPKGSRSAPRRPTAIPSVTP